MGWAGLRASRNRVCMAASVTAALLVSTPVVQSAGAAETPPASSPEASSPEAGSPEAGSTPAPAEPRTTSNAKTPSPSAKPTPVPHDGLEGESPGKPGDADKPKKAKPAPPPPPAWTKPLDLSGRNTWIGRASDSSLTYVGLPLPEEDSAEAEQMREDLLALDDDLAAVYDRYLKAQDDYDRTQRELLGVRKRLKEAQQRRDDAQDVVDVYIRAAYQGDPAASGTAELEILLTDGGTDALHAASLLRYGGVANARALDRLIEAEKRVKEAEAETQRVLDERRQSSTAISDEMASMRVQLDELSIVLGDEVTAQLADSLGQIPAAVVSQSASGGEVEPLTTRVTHFILLEGVPDAVVPGLSKLGVPMTAAWFGKAEVGDRTVGVVGIDPNTARSFSAPGMAGNDALWRVIARDDIIASHALTGAARLKLNQKLTLTGASNNAASRGSLGALATLGWPDSDVVTSIARARDLGAGTRRILLSSDGTSSEELKARVRNIVGPDVSIKTSGSMAPPASAFLSGNEASAMFGTFRYVPNANGTVAPDPGWVARNIVTATVPILGRVTCHRLMIPQLNGALTEVVESGLAAQIHPGQYAGCYYPRYIAYNSARGLSLHTWGVALDINVPGNLRGTQGEIDRRVVSIFKRWGFRWGGDWSYTDPMHFELGALLR